MSATVDQHKSLPYRRQQWGGRSYNGSRARGASFALVAVLGAALAGFCLYDLWQHGAVLHIVGALAGAVAGGAMVVIATYAGVHTALQARQRRAEHQHLLGSPSTRHLFKNATDADNHIDALAVRDSSSARPAPQRARTRSLAALYICSIWNFCLGRYEVLELDEEIALAGNVEEEGDLHLPLLQRTIKLKTALLRATNAGDMDTARAVLCRLQTLEITVPILRSTGIGVLVNRVEGPLREEAQNLVSHWRNLCQQIEPPFPEAPLSTVGKSGSTRDVVLALKERLLAAGRAGRIKEVQLVLKQLSQVDMTVQLLHETGIGAIVNGLRGPVARDSQALVRFWKNKISRDTTAAPVSAESPPQQQAIGPQQRLGQGQLPQLMPRQPAPATPPSSLMELPSNSTLVALSAEAKPLEAADFSKSSPPAHPRAEPAVPSARSWIAGTATTTTAAMNHTTSVLQHVAASLHRIAGPPGDTGSSSDSDFESQVSETDSPLLVVDSTTTAGMFLKAGQPTVPQPETMPGISMAQLAEDDDIEALLLEAEQELRTTLSKSKRRLSKEDFSHLFGHAADPADLDAWVEAGETLFNCTSIVPAVGLPPLDQEIDYLLASIRRVGLLTPSRKDQVVARFIDVFRDEVLEQQIESLVGTLKAARRRGLIAFSGQMLLQGVDDDVEIILLAR